MKIQQVIDNIANAAGIDPAAAERAAGTILSVIQGELDPATSEALFQKLPGASELADQNAVSPDGGGLLGSLASSVFGARAGLLAAGFNQLESSGLTMAQIETAASGVLAYVKANAGGDLAKKVAEALPSLGKSA